MKNKDQELENFARRELKEMSPNLIWRNESGEYEVFGRYRIVPQPHRTYQVFCYSTDVGVFNSTRTALSWCIADKYQQYTLAQELLTLDGALGNLNNDIFVRAAIADRSKRAQFREDIGTKLETKIINKKSMEIRLTNCVNRAKYFQLRGFNNETERTGLANKSSR